MQLRKGCRLWWVAIPAIAIDRICKVAITRAMVPGEVQSVLPGVLSWAYTRNRGVAFGLLSGAAALPLLTLLLIAALLIWMLRHPEAGSLLRTGLWLIVGGGLGNLYDRLAYGCVVDFIRLDFINFAIFNPADVFVCAGAVLVAVAVLAEDRRKAHG